MTPPVKQITAPKMAFRTAIILLVFVTIFTGLLSGAYLWTLPAIEAAASEEKMKLIDEVLPRSSYDNALLKDTIAIAATPILGQDEATTAYRARKNNQPQALVLEAVAPDGYAGKIRLLIALALQADFIGLQAQDLNLVTAVLVGVALVLPKIKARLRNRNAVAQACNKQGEAS